MNKIIRLTRFDCNEMSVQTVAVILLGTFRLEYEDGDEHNI